MPTFKVYITESDFLPGSQQFPTEMPRRFLGTVVANSKMSGSQLAYEKWPNEHGRFVLEVTNAVSAYMSEIGKKGGSKTSKAKADAVRKNAKKGGWPKGKPRKTESQEKE